MNERLAGKRVAIIVAQEYEDVELLYPLLRLSEEGAEIVVVTVQFGTHPRPWLENKPVTGYFGHPVPIPVMRESRRYSLATVEELNATELDCLLFPGGFSPDYLRRHAPTLALTCECYAQGKVVAAICHGPWVLIPYANPRGTAKHGPEGPIVSELTRHLVVSISAQTCWLFQQGAIVANWPCSTGRPDVASFLP